MRILLRGGHPGGHQEICVGRYVLFTAPLMQVLLVTGGSRDNRDLDSTEILEAAVSSAWRLVGPLPSARRGLRAASLSNRILVTGEGEEAGGCVSRV